MTEETGVVEAAAEPVVESDTQVAEAPEPQDAPASSAREALERAFQDEAETPVEQVEQVETAEGPQRDENGRFKAKEGDEAPKEGADPKEDAAPLSEAPARFSPDAKAEWDKAPKAVQGEVLRAMSEMEQGIEQYRNQVEPLKTFMDRATESGTTLPEALQRYVTMEDQLRKDPLAGLEAVVQNINPQWTLRGLAQHLTGQTPDQQSAQSDQMIAQLRNEISELKQGLGGVQQTFEQQRSADQMQQVEAFASDPAHSRFDELSDTIAQLLSSSMASDLAQAYQMAERLNPAPPAATTTTPAAQTRTPATAPPQPRTPSLSVSGAPSSGSSPARNTPPSTAREALERAFASG